MFRCIGQTRDKQGNLTQCAMMSDKPSVPDKPEWGFLCSACANRPPERFSRVSNGIEELDLEEFKNQVDETAGAGDGYNSRRF